ncbi:EnvF [Salmonella enterica subsp. enterica]|uniref:EnvF n=1 Tax=Salmonella enterica I TaxID=59201 RepID=A0A379WVW7_SALET|nr:EnvF [Salmonella enterica subsp. enterica]
MNKIHVTYKNLLLPITFIAATLISACDNDKDAMAEAEKNQEKYMQEIQQKEHQQSMFFYDNPKCKKLLPISTQKVRPILRLLKSVSSRAGIHSFDRALTPLLK